MVLRKTLSQQKSAAGAAGFGEPGIAASNAGVNMIVEEQKKLPVSKSEKTSESKRSQFSINQESSDSNEEVNRTNN
jgi:hypothetical protein